MLHGLTLLALSAAPTAPARPLPLLSAIARDEPCAEGAGDEVVVCGRREADERYRLPLRDEAGPATDRPIGEQFRLARDPFTSGPCGILPASAAATKPRRPPRATAAGATR